jgi:hypothetical protein
MRDLQRLVDAADVEALLLAVDGLTTTRDWDDLVDLARRCRDAVELGKQLWPVAMHIDYRLAYEAPASYAAAVLEPGAGRFALGPLTEVAASGHDWASLAPHLRDPVSASAVAQERVLRGEDLRDRAGQAPVGLADTDLPLQLAAWEGAYALPRYRDRSASFPQPEIATAPLGAPQALRAGVRLDDDAVVRAFEETVEVWTSQSAGGVQAVAVDGDAAAAIAHLADEAALRPVAPGDALALVQWAGASGGAYGRRRGGAAGRFAAWWLAAALAGEPWPPDPDALGEAVADLDWYRWTTTGAETGWVLRLAVHDPDEGCAWAVDAHDQRDEDDLDAS